MFANVGQITGNYWYFARNDSFLTNKSIQAVHSLEIFLLACQFVEIEGKAGECQLFGCAAYRAASEGTTWPGGLVDCPTQLTCYLDLSIE